MAFVLCFDWIIRQGEPLFSLHLFRVRSFSCYHAKRVNEPLVGLLNWLTPELLTGPSINEVPSNNNGTTGSTFPLSCAPPKPDAILTASLSSEGEEDIMSYAGV